MKNLNRNNVGRWVLASVFIILLFSFLPVVGQDNCDLRNNIQTGELEIYIDVVMESYSVSEDSIGMVWRYHEKRFTQWCNVDSLYAIHGETFKYEWGAINLQYLIDLKKYFKLFMVEWEGKKAE